IGGCIESSRETEAVVAGNAKNVGPVRREFDITAEFNGEVTVRVLVYTWELHEPGDPGEDGFQEATAGLEVTSGAHSQAVQVDHAIARARADQVGERLVVIVAGRRHIRTPKPSQDLLSHMDAVRDSGAAA